MTTELDQVTEVLAEAEQHTDEADYEMDEDEKEGIVAPDGFMIEFTIPEGVDPGSKVTKWTRRLLPLTAYPGEWAVVERGTNKQMQQRDYYLTKAHEEGSETLPVGSWQFTWRPESSGNDARLFARYMGTDE